jgi:hypothetical protein
MGRQIRADLRREAREALVPGEFLQAVLDQLAGCTASCKELRDLIRLGVPGLHEHPG